MCKAVLQSTVQCLAAAADGCSKKSVYLRNQSSHGIVPKI